MSEPIKRYQEFVDKIYDSNAKLDWRPESWLGERAESVTGPKYTKEDVRIFRSHVPEYKKIEKEARKNGTWLQMSDGTIWTGDPREWVIMQSEAFKKNYQENPWYTGQAEWATKVTLPDGTTVDTDKVKRARYHNGEMWFSNDAGYAQYFADAVGEGGVGRRNENYETSDVRGKVFLSAIPKKGNYRYLHNDSKGDLWWDMPYELTDNDIVRSKKIGKSKNDKWVIKSEGLNLKTDDIVNHSKKLGDDGIFMFNVMDGPVRRNIGNLPYYAVPNTGINEEMDPEGPSNSMHLEIPVNEFISQPGFTEKIKFIRGNNGNFDPNTDDKYSAIFKIDSPLFVKKGGRIHIKKKNRGKFTEYCGGKVTEECIARGKRSKNPLTRKRANFASVVRKWKHENGGVLKAQEGTGNLLTPHPLSPVGIALNQAKAMAKTKGEQQHLPPGVKEVVGPDGKKVAIRTEQPLVPLEQSIAEWLPGTGDVAEVGYIANDVKNGNYGTAALAAGLMVLPGNARKILDKFGVDLGDISTFKRLSDQEWDDMYFQAIDSGDMDLVQTIRDAHFKVKAAGASVDADGNLIKTYRGQYPKQKYKEHDLNPFSDKRDDNRSSGYFSSTSSQIADTYVQPGGDKFELYTNFTNPSVVDAKGKGYKTAVSQVEPDGRVVGIQTDAYVNKAFGQGYDGVIIKNVKDASVGNNLNDLEKIADDYVGAAGRSKLADPITRELDIFTGDYEIIPISRRDNFNMSDIRYGIVPLFLGLGAAKAVSNSGNTKEQQ